MSAAGGPPGNLDRVDAVHRIRRSSKSWRTAHPQNEATAAHIRVADYRALPSSAEILMSASDHVITPVADEGLRGAKRLLWRRSLDLSEEA